MVLKKSEHAGTSWAAQQRLVFIESCLLWSRRVTSKLVMDRFEISRPMAQSDITQYKKLAPKNVLPYRAADKAHQASETFTPLYLDNKLLEIAGKTASTTYGSTIIESSPVITRSIKSGVMAMVISAIDHGKDLEIMYASKTSPLGYRRRIQPAQIFFTLNRYHVRAYCYESEDHRDFLLSRILNTPKILSNHSRQSDPAFNNSLSVSLEVNDLLPQDGKQMIERENGLSEQSSYLIKECLLGYFLRDNNLPSTKTQLEEAKLDPWAFPIIASIEGERIEDYFFGKRFGA